MRVKDLEWVWDNRSEMWRAKSVLGEYATWVVRGKAYTLFPPNNYGALRGETIEEAKEAARAHFEAAIRSALVEPDGWQLVPVEPTEAMLDAYWTQTGESKEMRSRTHAYMRRYYRAMLAAAKETGQ
jgi:hypothetical protein